MALWGPGAGWGTGSIWALVSAERSPPCTGPCSPKRFRSFTARANGLRLQKRCGLATSTLPLAGTPDSRALPTSDEASGSAGAPPEKRFASRARSSSTLTPLPSASSTGSAASSSPSSSSAPTSALPPPNWPPPIWRIRDARKASISSALFSGGASSSSSSSSGGSTTCSSGSGVLEVAALRASERAAVCGCTHADHDAIAITATSMTRATQPASGAARGDATRGAEREVSSKCRGDARP